MKTKCLNYTFIPIYYNIRIGEYKFYIFGSLKSL